MEDRLKRLRQHYRRHYCGLYVDGVGGAYFLAAIRRSDWARVTLHVKEHDDGSLSATVSDGGYDLLSLQGKVELLCVRCGAEVGAINDRCPSCGYAEPELQWESAPSGPGELRGPQRAQRHDRVASLGLKVVTELEPDWTLGESEDGGRLVVVRTLRRRGAPPALVPARPALEARPRHAPDSETPASTPHATEDLDIPTFIRRQMEEVAPSESLRSLDVGSGPPPRLAPSHPPAEPPLAGSYPHTTKRMVRVNRVAPGSSPTEAAGGAHDVSLGVSSASAAAPGDEFTARFVAYGADEGPHVREVLLGLSPTARHVLDARVVTWVRGTEVRVSLHGRDVEVATPELAFVWQERAQVLEFDVRVRDDAVVDRIVPLKFDVHVANVLVTTVRFDLAILASRSMARAAPPAATTVAAPRSAFASYASADRHAVVARLSTLHAVAGVDVFIDHLDLLTGERWRERLEHEIVRRERFLLFWSRQAAASEYVRWEYQTALRTRGLDVILPQPLEPAKVAPIPPDLAELHFGDRFSGV